MNEEGKRCSKCGIFKPFDQFFKQTGRTDGHRSNCKECVNSVTSSWATLNKDKKNKHRRRWRLAHPGAERASKHSYNIINATDIAAYNRKYKQDHKQKITAKRHERLVSDPSYKLERKLRSRQWDVFQGTVKSGHMLELLGCTIEFAKQWIESKFQPGMTWKNWGFYGWHIDHVIPISSFDLNVPEQQRKCFHYTNLQPLWWRDNLSKNDRLDWNKNCKETKW
jgi:hypothetical protein